MAVGMYTSLERDVTLVEGLCFLLFTSWIWLTSPGRCDWGQVCPGRGWQTGAVSILKGLCEALKPGPSGPSATV